MKSATACVLMCCVCFLQGCAPPRAIEPGPNTEAFDIELGNGAKWASDTLRFDPGLPGYHLTGGIGTITLRRRPGVDLSRLFLEIETSPGMPPNLESFTFACGDTLLRASASGTNTLTEVIAKNADGRWETVSQKETKDFFEFQKGDSTVTVSLLPPALQLGWKECTIRWIDWFRR